MRHGRKRGCTRDYESVTRGGVSKRCVGNGKERSKRDFSRRRGAGKKRSDDFAPRLSRNPTLPEPNSLTWRPSRLCEPPLALPDYTRGSSLSGNGQATGGT